MRSNSLRSFEQEVRKKKKQQEKMAAAGPTLREKLATVMRNDGQLQYYMDADRKPEIGFHEFKRGMVLAGIHYASEDEVQALFESLPRNTSGCVSWADLQKELGTSSTQVHISKTGSIDISQGPPDDDGAWRQRAGCAWAGMGRE